MHVDAKDILGLEISQIPIPGMISLFEEHSTRSSSGYTLQEWYNLTSREKALEVALSRINKSIEYQKQKSQERASKKK